MDVVVRSLCALTNIKELRTVIEITWLDFSPEVFYSLRAGVGNYQSFLWPMEAFSKKKKKKIPNQKFS